jgi:hypothetical protein
MRRRARRSAATAARWGGHGCGLFEDWLGLLVLLVLRAGFLSTRGCGGVAAIPAAASATATGAATAAFGGGAFALLLFAFGFGAGGAELLGASVAFRILVVVLLVIVVVFVILVETRLVEPGRVVRGLVEARRVEMGLFGRLGEGSGRQG